MNAAAPVRLVYDRLVNLVAQLGTARDKTTHDQYFYAPLTQAQVEAAYRGDWIARKVVDVPAFDSVRAWRDWQADDEDIQEIEGVEQALGVQLKLKRAMTRARLYGGGAIILGMADETPDQELDVDRVKKDDLKFAHVVTRHEITVQELRRNVLDPFYGHPVYYEVSSDVVGNVRVHPSRVIRLIGNEIPATALQTDAWGDSVLDAVDSAVKNAALASGGIASLVHEAKIDVIRVPNLMQSLGTAGYTEKLTQRVGLAAQLKSTNAMLLLDKDEEWERKQVDFSALPDVLRQYLQIAAGAADIPATRLLGQSPTGLNATGESDIRNYYDRISSEQVLILSPALQMLDEVIIRSALGARPDDIFYNWSPLWQMSENDKAEVAKKKAEATKIYVDSAVVPLDALARAVTNQLVEDGTYPGLEAALEEAEQEPEEFALGEKEAAEEVEREALEAANTNIPSGKRTATGDAKKGRRGPLVRDARSARRLRDSVKPSPAFRKLIKLGDARPRTLYVRRDVVNAARIVEWAKGQGFETTLPASEMHVTIAFSKTPVDWMKVGSDYSAERDGRMVIPPGGARVVEPLGDKGAVVLLFNSSMLAWRHESIKQAGASWDWSDYQPHITLSYRAELLNLDEVTPYRGEIVLGPEIFEEVDEEWSAGVMEG